MCLPFNKQGGIFSQFCSWQYPWQRTISFLDCHLAKSFSYCAFLSQQLMKDTEFLSLQYCAVLYNIFLKIIIFLCPLQKNVISDRKIKCFAAEIEEVGVVSCPKKNEDQDKKTQAKLKSNAFWPDVANTCPPTFQLQLGVLEHTYSGCFKNQSLSFARLLKKWYKKECIIFLKYVILLNWKFWTERSVKQVSYSSTPLVGFLLFLQF